MPSLFSGCRDGTHPLAVGPVNPGLFPGQADQTGSAGGCHENLGPADRSFRRTTRAASADSEVRPGPRPPTLTPHQVKAREAGPEALPTSSLPTRCDWDWRSPGRSPAHRTCGSDSVPYVTADPTAPV